MPTEFSAGGFGLDYCFYLNVDYLLDFQVLGFIFIVTALHMKSTSLQLNKIISPHDAQSAHAIKAMTEWTARNCMEDAKSRLMLSSFLPLGTDDWREARN